MVLLAGALLLQATFQVCQAVSVLPGSGDMDTLPDRTSAGYSGVTSSAVFDEQHSNDPVERQLQPGALPVKAELQADDRLFLFVLLGFAAVAAWLADVPGRKR